MDNTIVWADIPVADLDRAMKFYGAVLQTKFAPVEGMDGIALEVPPEDFDSSSMEPPFPVSFDLALMPDHKPSTDGATIYLNGHDDAEGLLERAAAAGGEILAPVEYVGEMVGSLGFFKDSEGNRIGVHKPPEMDTPQE